MWIIVSILAVIGGLWVAIFLFRVAGAVAITSNMSPRQAQACGLLCMQASRLEGRKLTTLQQQTFAAICRCLDEHEAEMAIQGLIGPAQLCEAFADETNPQFAPARQEVAQIIDRRLDRSLPL